MLHILFIRAFNTDIKLRDISDSDCHYQTDVLNSSGIQPMMFCHAIGWYKYNVTADCKDQCKEGNLYMGQQIRR